MPKKNKKSKSSKDSKKQSENAKSDGKDVCSESHNDISRAPSVASDEKLQEKSFCLPLDKKLKLRVKKRKGEKKKVSKSESELEMVSEKELKKERNKDEVGLEPVKTGGTESDCILTKEIVKVLEKSSPNHVYTSDDVKATESQEKDKNNLEHSQKSLLICQTQRENGHLKQKADEMSQNVDVGSGDMIEEFIEAKETEGKTTKKETPEEIPRKSSRWSKSKKKCPKVFVKDILPPKAFHDDLGSSHGSSNAALNRHPNDGDTCHNRHLDVIQEENNEINGTNENSIKNNKEKYISEDDGRRKLQLKTNENPLRNRLNKYSVFEGIKEEDSINDVQTDDSCDTQLISDETTDVSKTDLTNIEGNKNIEIDRNETFDDGLGFVKEPCKTATADEIVKNSNESKEPAADQQEQSTWSMRSISSVSTKLLEEESESWKSSIETCEGSEDESETLHNDSDSLLLSACEEDLSFLSSVDPLVSCHDTDFNVFVKNYANKIFSDNRFKSPINFSIDKSVSDCIFDFDPAKHESASKEGETFKVKSSSYLREHHSVYENHFPRVDSKKEIEFSTIPSVNTRKNLIKDEIDKILISKLKVIQSLEECKLSKGTWANVLENAKAQLEKKNLQKTQFEKSNSNNEMVSNFSSDENDFENETIRSLVRFDAKTQSPEALSNLAEKKILTLPYGKLILKNIGLGKCCSKKSCSEGSRDVEEDMYVKSEARLNDQSFGLSSEVSEVSSCRVPTDIWNGVQSFGDNECSVDSRAYIEFDYGDSRIGQTEKWYGRRTAVPTVFLGLSPAQKEVYEKGLRSNRFVREEAEAANLIDLHRKFIERRSYEEPNLYHGHGYIRPNSRAESDLVALTEIGDRRLASGKGDLSNQTNKKLLFEKVKDGRFANENVEAPGKFGLSPGGLMQRLARNGKSKNGYYLLKSNGRGEDEDRNRNGSEFGEKIKMEGKKRSEEKSDCVGKSCLLAILQNAISDNSASELNKDSSVNSTGENHEDSSIEQFHKTMLNSWQVNPIFRYTPSISIENDGTENLFEEGRQKFERIWYKEKDITTGEKKTEGRSLLKTICRESKSESVAGGNSTKNEMAADKKAPVKKMKLKDDENSIVTENLPPVSDVIKSFEEPKPKPRVACRTDPRDTRQREIQIDTEKYSISKRGDIAFLQNGDDKRKIRTEKRKSMPVSVLSEKEEFNQKMYNEYMSKLAERIERRQKKVIRVSQSNEFEGFDQEFKCLDLENEFIKKVKERREKFAAQAEDAGEFVEPLRRPTSDGLSNLYDKDFCESDDFDSTDAKSGFGDENRVKGESGSETLSSKRSSVQFISDATSNVEGLPEHLKEFLQVEKEEFPDILSDCRRIKQGFAESNKLKHRKINLLKEIDDNLVLSKGFLLKRGIWSPTQKISLEKTEITEENLERKKLEDEPIPPVWTPKSAQASPVLERKEFRPVNFESPILSRKKYVQEEKKESSVPPPWHHNGGDKFIELSKSPSSPVLSLPKAPNPTVTLLQKAREGQLPRGAHYLNAKMNESGSNDDKLTADDRLEIVSLTKTESVRPKKVEVAPKKIIGIGPTTKEGIPLVLRSEVEDESKEKWYKRMYDSLHKAGSDDDYVTVKYRTSPSRKGLYGSQGYQYGSGSGYQSEPESSNYDLSQKKYISLDLRPSSENKEVETSSSTSQFDTRVSPPRKEYSSTKSQPGRIENYEPGHSSINELETNKWWDEVLEFFDRDEETSRPVRNESSSKSFTDYASGYISDPQYIYKRNEEEIQSPVSSEEQKEAYRIIQKGGEIPLKGLRKPAPERPKENVDAEIEYFPLSSTLTRIRVHKQNITPLNEFPFYPNPSSLYRETTLNFPGLPFGLFNSFSQVQIYPSFPSHSQYSNSENQLNLSPTGKNQKFSVQLQNISGADDYVQIVPKPRNLKSKSHIYANLPLNGSDPSSDLREEHRKTVRFAENVSSDPTKDIDRVPGDIASKKLVEKTTFCDLKRTAPSIITLLNSKSVSGEATVGLKRIKHIDSKVPFKLPKSTKDKCLSRVRCTIGKTPKTLDKTARRNNRETLVFKPGNQSAKKITKTEKKCKIDVLESFEKEKSISKANKRLKSFSENFSKKKQGSRKLSGDLVEKKKKIKEKNCLVNSIGTKSRDLKRIKPVSLVTEIGGNNLEVFNPETMAPTRRENDEEKPKVEEDVTEKFRSRSFSPEVRRKIFKFPDMNKPVPSSTKKQSKIGPTIKMWVKMKDSGPSHRSRFDEFGSNIKFLQDKIKRKLKDVRDVESDVETVRTVKKSKNGEMSIKTDRYVRLAHHPSGLVSTFFRSTYPTIEGRKQSSETRKRYGSIETLKSSRSNDQHLINKSVESSASEINLKESKVRGSGGEGSIESSVKSEILEKKSMKITTEASSKDSRKKDVGRGTSSVKKTPVFVKSSSPCPSTSSHRSGVSLRSSFFDETNVPSSERMMVSHAKVSSPTSSASRFSSTWESISPDSSSARSKIQKTCYESLKPGSKTTSSKRVQTKTEFHKYAAGQPSTKTKTTPAKTITVKKASEKKLTKMASEKKENRIKKVDIETSKEFKKHETSKTKMAALKKPKEIIVKVVDEKENENEITKGRDLVRTDSFFQNLFLRGPVDVRPTFETEKISSVLERARIYQRRINLFDTYKSEPSLSLTTYYLNQKRPVSLSKFRRLDRDLSSSRSQSPLGSFHSENFQMKLRRFDSMSQFGDGFNRDFSPEGKERSSSEPPLARSTTNSPEEVKSFRISQSEISSMRSSPISSRSPSCRRIKCYRMASKSLETPGPGRRQHSWIQTVSESEEKSKPHLHRDFGRSSSSLNLSTISDHTEYQAHLLELMHSTRKCERFRELHRFYSNLERIGRLEKTASTGDLRPRLRNEEIIDFDRWKKVRTKERAEAELKVLVDNLMKVQKEKDLLFRAADADAIRWKGDRDLRIKERSVEDLKDHFDRCARRENESDRWKNDLDFHKDHYKLMWKGNLVGDVVRNLNEGLIPCRGRLITVEELKKIEEKNAKIGKEYGYSLKAWSNLSTEQVNLLKDQLNEIYAQDVKRKRALCSTENLLEKYEIVVPKEAATKAPGESSLQVRCSSAMSKSQTFTPTIKRKENLRREWKKSDSIGALPSLKSDDKDGFRSRHSPKDEPGSSKYFRSHSETRYSEESFRPISRSKSPRPLSEDEKKQLSLSLSKEVIEKMATKGSGKATVLPRETLGAVAAANIKMKNEGDILHLPPVTLEESKTSKDIYKMKKGFETTGRESGSGSSETSIKTVIRKNSTDVLKKVQYFEELQQNVDSVIEPETKYEEEIYKEAKHDERYRDDGTRKSKEETFEMVEMKKEKGRMLSASSENLNDYFGHHKQYATSILPCKTTPAKLSSKKEETSETKSFYEENKWSSYTSTSPVAFHRVTRYDSNDSLFSCRSRSVSPDPTKYYRAYLKLVKCGAVRKLCNKFESWEDLLSLTSDKDFWLPPAPRRFASDPELTRDLLRRFGTDPTKVTIKGQEVGNVRWLRTKFEKDSNPGRGRSRFRRMRSPLLRSPITAADRFMPRINVISKKAELQLQKVDSDQKSRSKSAGSPTRFPELPGSPEGYRSLIDYTKDHGGYYYTGEVEKLKRKFERLEEAERLSILGQMYTSAPDVNELRDIAPYLECSWVAHRFPSGARSSEVPAKKREISKKVQAKPRPRSSSPAATKQPSSILKQNSSFPPSDQNIFADQKFDPTIHRPKYRYQPEKEIDRSYNRSDLDWWRHWNKPSVKFKDTINFYKIDPETCDLSPDQDSPRKYVESEVTIHYKSPVRSETKAMLSNDELARRQAESMKRIYKEERRRKYLQELQDMNSRRHTDNFMPSQKSPIPLNRYDDFPVEPNVYHSSMRREYSVDPVLVARGLYDFVGRRPRELAFRRGDIIFIVRRLDKNWCEGELNGVVGLFPLSYVEVIPYYEINMRFGRAIAKYDFVPQTPLELSARRGDTIILLRKIDENWFEGRIGDKTGIIPASYCHILAVPQTCRSSSMPKEKVKPVAAPAAHSLIHNGSGLSSKHYYAPYLSNPNSPGRSTVSSASANHHEGSLSADTLIDEALMQLDEELDLKRSPSKKSNSQTLNLRASSGPEPALYQVLFNHVPNNDDELELIQGETVTVIEKCGDGWYIGSKTSDGKLGIFPGTHVRRIASEFV